MSRRYLRATWCHATIVAALSAGALVGTPALAISGGTAAPNGSYGFTAKVQVGDSVSCSGALVAPQWVITAAGCFADGGQPVAAGAPARPTMVTVGRTDLSTGDGRRVAVIALVPRTDRTVVLAKLAAPVTDVTPVSIAASPPRVGESLRIAGYGRTTTEWVPDRLQTAVFTVDGVTGTSFEVTGAAPGKPSTCRGDAGGPALREASGAVELVGVNAASWQHGCLGETGSRTGGTEARVDDLGSWVAQQTRPTAQYLRNVFTKRCLAVDRANSPNDGPVFQHDCGPANAGQAWELVTVTGGVQVRNRDTGLCLYVSYRRNTNGAAVLQFQCEAAYNDQLWTLEPVGDGFQLRNVNTQRCLTVPANNNANEAPAQQFDCFAGFADQVWQTDPAPDGVRLKNAASKRCLFVTFRTPENGAPVSQVDCADYADQLWEVRHVAGGLQLQNRYTRRCALVYARTNTNGAAVQQVDCDPPYNDQLWTVEAAAGGFQIRNNNSGRCLAVPSDNLDNGAPAVQVDCKSPAPANQVWSLEAVPLPAPA